MHIPKTRYAAALGIPLLAILSFTLVTAWTDPTQSPPNGNVAAPVNVGTTDQVKNAGLGVNSLAVFGNSVFGGSTGSNAYLNFGATTGTNGYGIRDNGGLLEFKNSGGSWASLQATIFNLGAGSWAASGNDIYNTNSDNVRIGTTNPTAKLDVAGSAKLTGNGTGNVPHACTRRTNYIYSNDGDVYCAAGEVALGGGSRCENNNYPLVHSYPYQPTATTWAWHAYHSGQCALLYIYAVCCKL